MKQLITFLSISAFLFSCKDVATKSKQTTNNTINTTTTKENANTTSAHDFALTNIDGEKFSLKDYAGKKILIVNTASKCGYTKQYAALEELYKKFNDKLVVIGFPCNDFGGQEPENEAGIKSFCQKNYGVTFPLTEKISVKGESTAPIYKWLTQKSLNGVLDATIKWNFNKFLIDEKGNLLSYFPSSTSPMDSAITSLL
jgi:glutathione peroxidase